MQPLPFQLEDGAFLLGGTVAARWLRGNEITAVFADGTRMVVGPSRVRKPQEKS
jgi:hypothetical protein